LAEPGDGVLGVRKSLSALLFDFDGTIADTSLAWRQCILAAFARSGFRLDDSTVDLLLVSPWRDVIADLTEAGESAIESDMVAAMSDMHLACPLQAGIEHVLQAVSGVPMAIVTSSYRERLVVPYLRQHGLEGYFAAIVGSEDTEVLKPRPEPVLAALRLLDADPAGAWLIGDSVADVAAAKSAGIRSIALGPEPIGADRVAESTDSLRIVLAELATEHEDSARAARRRRGPVVAGPVVGDTVIAGESGEHL